MPQIPVQAARQGATLCELNSMHICRNVLFCFVLFDFAFILLFFAGVLSLSVSVCISLSVWAHPRVKVEAKPEAAHTMLIVALQLEHVLLNATLTHSHTPSRVLWLVPRVVLVTSSYYPHAPRMLRYVRYMRVCVWERVHVSVCSTRSVLTSPLSSSSSSL